jgi:anionic cell wall polymer biosynthesis LytR-Cps2A-Psr (LCP) family protein
MLNMWKNLSMMFTYVSTIVLLYYRTSARNFLAKIAPYGKMSLTNYLGQSIIGGFVFYNWGLGMFRYSGHASSLLMGVKINHYISITMDAVPLLNDLVGGVEVTVLDDFSSFDKTMVEGANIVLSGEQALKYIRSRAGLDDSTNASRMSRQKQYMDCFYKQFQEKIKEDDKFIADASLKVSDYIVSDRSVTQLQEIAKKINNYEFLGIKTLEGETRMGEKYIEFYPNEDFVKKTVVDLFYKIKE